MNITAAQIAAWRSCWIKPDCTQDLEAISMFTGEGKTPREILEVDITTQEKIWVLLHEEVFPAEDLFLFALDLVNHYNETFGKIPNDRMAQAITVTHKRIAGENVQEQIADVQAAAFFWNERLTSALVSDTPSKVAYGVFIKVSPVNPCLIKALENVEALLNKHYPV